LTSFAEEYTSAAPAVFRYATAIFPYLSATADKHNVL